MFEWCKGSDLRDFVRANIPGAEYDDWLEGWMHGIVQQRFRLWAPVDMLDVEVGSGPRPYLDAFRRQGARIESADAGALNSSQFLSDRQQRYGLITVLSLEREQCLQPLDLANPLPFAELLLNAARLLDNGGVLIWSNLYCYSSDPESVRSFLEPAAVYQMLRQRSFLPMSHDDASAGRVAIFHDLDTLWVRHQALLEHSRRHERVTRVCCAVKRRGRCRVRYMEREEPAGVPWARRMQDVMHRASFLLRG